jgi:hypothetical protein
MSTGFLPWLEAFSLSQVCQQTRTEFWPLALRAQRIVLDLDVLFRYLSGLYPSQEDIAHSPERLFLHIFGCACTTRPGPVIFDILPLLRFQHMSGPGRTLVTAHGGRGRSRKRVADINDFIRYANAQWISQLRSGRIANVMIYSGTPRWEDPY